MPSDRSTPLERTAGALSAIAQRSGFASFLRWWGAELAPLVPSGARNAVARRRMRPILAFDGPVATVWRPVMVDGAVKVEPTARITLDGDAQAVVAAGRAAIGELGRLAGSGASGAPRVRLAIPARAVLRKTLVLPAAVEENLRQAIGYDLDRLTPFKADELYYDAAVVSRDAGKGTVAVDFAAVRRPVVDAALAHAALWGADVRSVTPDEPGAPPSRLNLAPDESRAAPAPWKRWQFWAPLAALGAVTLVAIVLPLWQKRDYAIALIGRAQAAREEAAVSERLRADVENAAAQYNFVLERKYAYPPIVRVLDTMSSVLPDDTWITQLEIRALPKGRDRDREIVVRGESGNAGALIPILESSGLVAQVAPRSPVTKIQPGPGEIFDLGAQLKPAAKPAMVTVLALADPPARAPEPAAPPPAPPQPAPANAAPAPSSASLAPASAAPVPEPASAGVSEKEGSSAPVADAPAPPAAAPAPPQGEAKGMGRPGGRRRRSDT